MESTRASTYARPPLLDRAGRLSSRTASDPAGLTHEGYSVESYTRTVRPLTGVMVAIARRILGDEVQAWDAVQEALIALWNEEEVPANPRAWLVRAVVLRSLH